MMARNDQIYLVQQMQQNSKRFYNNKEYDLVKQDFEFQKKIQHKSDLDFQQARKLLQTRYFINRFLNKATDEYNLKEEIEDRHLEMMKYKNNYVRERTEFT